MNKQEILDIIKNIDLQELVIPDEANRKWFKFGAYEMGRLISERIKNTVQG